MNKGIIVGCALCLGALSSNAENVDIKQFRYAGPYSVQKPFMSEEKNAAGKMFQEEDLLNSILSPDAVRTGRVLEGGVLPSTPGYALHLAGFSVDNTRFAKGRLTVKGVKHYAVYIDGKEHKGGEVTLTPATHQFVIKCLTMPDESDTLSVSLESEQEGVFSINESGKRLYVLDDAINGRRFSGIGLSADGRYLITTYTTTLAGGDTESRSRVTEVSTGRVVTETPLAIHWMPTSCRDYYTRRNVE